MLAMLLNNKLTGGARLVGNKQSRPVRGIKGAAFFAIFALTLTACQTQSNTQGAEVGTDNSVQNGVQSKVTLIVHDSFDVPDFVEMASKATGYDVEVITSGSGQELSTTLALTKGAPLADAFFGIDNVFASRLVENEVLSPFVPANLPTRAQEYLYDDAGSLTPITLSATCINIDSVWFAEHKIKEPAGYSDLLLPEYKDLLVLIDPLSSTTGAAFYFGTIAAFGSEKAVAYWSELEANGARIEQGWSDAYYGQFSAASAEGTKPIVVSYSSSPAYTVDEAGASTTKALLDTCSSTVEYAGVLKGAKNEAGAKAVVEYLLSAQFQDQIADTMYVYPISQEANLPEEWQTLAPLPTQLHNLAPAEIGANREAWLRDLAKELGL